MIVSRAEFVYSACVDALNTVGLNGDDLVFPVFQENPDERTTVVYTLIRETRYQTLDGVDNTDMYEITIRSDDYTRMRNIDKYILDNLQSNNRLLLVESGADFVEDTTNRDNLFGRRRVVEID